MVKTDLGGVEGDAAGLDVEDGEAAVEGAGERENGAKERERENGVKER